MQALKRVPRGSSLLTPVLVALWAWVLIDLSRPDCLIVGNITVDLVEGTTPTGGAVSYAAVAAKALKASSCVVTVAGPEADLDVFEGSSLFVLPANETLTFEHTYAWWGHSRRLRVTANPNITITKAHVPWRCRLARVVLLGPLTLHDVDAASFARHGGFWDRLLNPNQQIGLMAQGFQRDLDSGGEVLPLPEPSEQLLAGLSPRVSLFLSDVETDTWSAQALAGVVAAAGRVIITQGDKGAELVEGVAAAAAAAAAGGATGEHRAQAGSSSAAGSAADSGSGGTGSGSAASSSRSSSSRSGASQLVRTPIPPVKVPKAVDTNGAGDTFATMFMLALMRGDPAPGNTASWAASRAVMQPQTCKPRCAPLLVTEPGGVPPIGPWERVQLAVRPLLAQAAAVVARGVATLSAALPQQQAWLIEQGARQLQGWLDGVLVGRGVGCTGGGGVCVGM